MAYKPKKVDNKKKKNKKEKDPNKFHLGWNTGTYLLITLGIVLLAIIALSIAIPVSYSNTYNENTQHPFADAFTTEDYYKDVPTVEAADFKELTISFYATSFDSHDANIAKFKVEIVTNENTGGNIDLINSNLEHADNGSGSYGLYAQINLSDNWIGFNHYSSLTGFYRSYLVEDSKQAKTIEVGLGDTVFPAKTNNWPVPVEVKWPDAYLFVCYYLQNQSTPKKYIIHYTPADYIVTVATEGKSITSPAV